MLKMITEYDGKVIEEKYLDPSNHQLKFVPINEDCNLASATKDTTVFYHDLIVEDVSKLIIRFE